MSQTMLELLRTETARVYMTLVQRDDDNSDTEPRLVPHENGKWMPEPNTFVYLHTLITNLSRMLFISPVWYPHIHLSLHSYTTESRT